MRELPILFATDMVRANLEDRKTMTRRTRGLERINVNPNAWRHHWDVDRMEFIFSKNDGETVSIKSPYGIRGDVLWGRETFFPVNKYRRYPIFRGCNSDYLFAADRAFIGDHKWKPSIHMPKAAARLWLMNDYVVPERLKDISEEDAIAEGIDKDFDHVLGMIAFPDGTIDHSMEGKVLTPYKDYLREKHWLMNNPIGSYESLWDSINGPGSWDKNPWVWVIKYKILSKTGRPQI